MSKVRLRSRNHKLTKSDVEVLALKNVVRRSLRRNGNIGEIEIKKRINIGDDKNGSESSLAETSSLNCQSLCKWKGCDFEYIFGTETAVSAVSGTSGAVNLSGLSTNAKQLSCVSVGTGTGYDLEQHLMEHHVKTQLCSHRRFFVCLWNDCKVFNKKSLSYMWLERHVLEHTENRNKPFPCIFNCSMRFSTPALLERHVQYHLSSSNSNVNSNGNVNCLMSNCENSADWASAFNLSNSSMLSGSFNSNYTQSLAANGCPTIQNECKVRRSSCQTNKLKLEFTPYHVHRTDYLNSSVENYFANSNAVCSLLQNHPEVFTLRLSGKFSPQYLTECISNHSEMLLRLLTQSFEVIGSRKQTNNYAENLVRFHLLFQKRKIYEWIDENLVEVAKTYLSFNLV